jgi:hypothetical protein
VKQVDELFVGTYEDDAERAVRAGLAGLPPKRASANLTAAVTASDVGRDFDQDPGQRRGPSLGDRG